MLREYSFTMCTTCTSSSSKRNLDHFNSTVEAQVAFLLSVQSIVRPSKAFTGLLIYFPDFPNQCGCLYFQESKDEIVMETRKNNRMLR